MKRLVLLPLVMVLLCPDAFAYRDKLKKKDHENSFYLHPFSLALAPPFAARGIVPVPFYLTAEFPINRQSAIIVNPSLLAGRIEDELNYFRIGSGVGIRSFLISDREYLQLMSGAHYRYAKVDGYKSHPGFMIDILLYLGYRLSRISYIDVGLGFEYLYWKGGLEKEIDGDKFFSFSRYYARKGGFFSMDFNIGVRLPLF